jgi:outer membrane protein
MIRSLRLLVCSSALALCVAGAPRAAHAQVVTLQALEQHAVQHRPMFDAQRARLLQGNAQIEKAQSYYNPTVSAGLTLSASPGRELVEFTDPNAPDNKYLVAGSRTIDDSRAYTPQARYGLTLGLRGNLYDFGRTSAAVDAARAGRSATEAEAKALERRLLLDLRGAYIRWAVAHALAKLAQEAAVSAEQHEKRTLGLIEEGMRPTVDGTVAAQETAVARLEAAHAAEALAAARIDLAYVAARELPESAEPEPILTSGTAEAATEATTSHEIDALERGRSAALSRARMQDRAIAPVITYDAATGLQGQTLNLFPVYSVGVGISAVLWDGGLSSASADEARAEASALSAQVSEQQALLAHQGARMKSAREYAERRLQLAAATLQLAEAQVAQLAEDAGVDSATYALQAGAEAARLRARREVLLAQTALLQARLGLTP